MLGQQSAQHCQTPGRADAQSQSEPATRRRPIPSHFSVYLDLLRLAMAVDVVLFHLRTIGVGPLSIQHLLPGTGHECVIVFFVLSGYIIAATAERKDSTLLDYALDRFARVYSVAIPALLISTAASLALGVGSHADVLAALAANLTFVGESWSANAFPPTDPPFWSLCYEVMYYTLFGCAVYLRGIARVAALTLVVLLAGPKVLLLLPCWLLGAIAYQWRDRFSLGKIGAIVAGLVLPGLAFGALTFLQLGAKVDALFGASPALAFSQHFAKDYITASIIALHLYAMRSLVFVWPACLGRTVVAFAGFTFTLYLVHYPILLAVQHSQLRYSLPGLALSLVLVATAVYVVGTLTELRRHRVRAWMTAIVGSVVRWRRRRLGERGARG